MEGKNTFAQQNSKELCKCHMLHQNYCLRCQKPELNHSLLCLLFSQYFIFWMKAEKRLTLPTAEGKVLLKSKVISDFII